MVSTAALDSIALSGNLGHSVFKPKMSTRNANFKQWFLDLIYLGTYVLWLLVDISGQPVETSSLFLPCGFPGLNLRCGGKCPYPQSYLAGP